ncbi:MAG TPA: prolipoprotein diacylglyceryl transferase [Patescibacteria group bacterium]|nr:prolipoprotein diacylglyceryl transferase [Patescibacteria group bacterium]
MDFTPPQYFTLLGLHVHFYSLSMGVAVACGYLFTVKRAKNLGLENIDDVLFWVILCGFVGARAYHVLSDFQYYLENPAHMVAVWRGGLSIYGAVIGGVLTLLYKTRDWWKWADVLTPGLLLGQIIGRVGNYFNQELYGLPTNLPWGIYISPEHRTEEYMAFTHYHPLFAYEMIANTIILCALLVYGRQPKGSLFCLYLILYNICRVGLEFVRVQPPFLFGFRQNLLVSLVLIACGIVLYAKRKK